MIKFDENVTSLASQISILSVVEVDNLTLILTILCCITILIYVVLIVKASLIYLIYQYCHIFCQITSNMNICRDYDADNARNDL